MKNIISFLDLYNYKYTVNDETIVVKINFKHTSIIKFDGSNLIIDDKLERWNPISGIMRISLINSLFLNSLLMSLIIIVVEISKGFEHNIHDESYIIQSILICTLYICWIVIYAIKLESFKVRLNVWIQKD